MSERIAKKQSLFTVPPAPSTETELLGARCSGGHLSFPPQTMGCEVCGAYGEEIERVAFPASGTLQTFALAHRQQRPGSDAPLILGTVVLDAGPSVEVVLDVDDVDELACGQRVAGHLAPVGADESGTPIVDCYFAPVRSSEGAG